MKMEKIREKRKALEKIVFGRRKRGPRPKLIDHDNLTKKEQMFQQAWEILRMKNNGKTNQQIAWRLGVSRRTVQNRYKMLLESNGSCPGADIMNENIARLHCAGYSQDLIANTLGINQATVSRRLKQIRQAVTNAVILSGMCLI